MYLLVNDDGIHATGIKMLQQVFDQQQLAYTIVAPDSNCSGYSHALTLDKPIKVRQFADNHIAVDGTPVDCVHISLNGLLKDKPVISRVVSGINRGANLGDDALYSGTVAAAMEGRFLQHSALAVSLASFVPQHWPTAVAIVTQLLEKLPSLQLAERSILNVNIPDLPLSSIKGFKVTRLGARNRSDDIVETVDPRGSVGYWICLAGTPLDCGEGTDFHAVANGYVSLTPLCPDLTAHELIADTQQWLADSEIEHKHVEKISNIHYTCGLRSVCRSNKRWVK